jgi:hypothetical protein
MPYIRIAIVEYKELRYLGKGCDGKRYWAAREVYGGLTVLRGVCDQAHALAHMGSRMRRAESCEI